MTRRTYRRGRRRVYRKRRIGRPLRGTTNSVQVLFHLENQGLTAWGTIEVPSTTNYITTHSEDSFAEFIPKLSDVLSLEREPYTSNFSYYRIVKLLIKCTPLYSRPDVDPYQTQDNIAQYPDAWAFSESPLMWRPIATPQEALEYKALAPTATPTAGSYYGFRSDNGTHVKSGYRKCWVVNKLRMNDNSYNPIDSVDTVNVPARPKWIPIQSLDVPHFGVQIQVDASHNVGYPFLGTTEFITNVTRRSQRWNLEPMLLVQFRDKRTNF